MAHVKHPHASKSPREELMAVHGAMAAVRVDPEQHLAFAAADLGRALAQIKCPNNYPSGLSKYELTSSILPIRVAMAMFCMVDVLSMFVPCLFQYCTLCDVQILPCPAQFHQYQQQTYNT